MIFATCRLPARRLAALGARADSSTDCSSPPYRVPPAAGVTDQKSIPPD